MEAFRAGPRTKVARRGEAPDDRGLASGYTIGIGIAYWNSCTCHLPSLKMTVMVSVRCV